MPDNGQGGQWVDFDLPWFYVDTCGIEMFDGFCGLHYWNTCNLRDQVFVAGCSLVIDSISLHSYAATCEILPLKIPHVQNMKILAAGSCHPRASPRTTSPKMMVRELPKTNQFQVGESYNNTI